MRPPRLKHALCVQEMKSKKPTWYGVQTLYRYEAVGSPKGTDRHYSAQVTGVEVRVVVVRARSPREAVQKGKREAKQYASYGCYNPYGQRVRTRHIGVIDAYHIDEPLIEGTEVFSSSEVVNRKVSDRTVAKRLIGRPGSKQMFDARRNLLDIVFQAPAPGVKRNRRDQRFYEQMHAALKRLSNREHS